MRIESVSIKNLRCIKDSVANLGAYTCLVGPNGAGKSTLLHALNILFRHVEDASTDVTSLTPEDFYLHDTTSPIEITVTFTGLPKEAEEDFKGYVRQGKLIISVVATFDSKSNRAEVRQFGQRLGMAAFRPFFRAHGDGEPVSDLKAVFERLAGCGKTRFEARTVPQNSLVSTAQPDKKKVCVEKTSSSWMCSADRKSTR